MENTEHDLKKTMYCYNCTKMVDENLFGDNKQMCLPCLHDLKQRELKENEDENIIENNKLNVSSSDKKEKKKRVNLKIECGLLRDKIYILEHKNKKLVNENEKLKNDLKDYNTYKSFIYYLKENKINSMKMLKNNINENISSENKSLKFQLINKDKELDIYNNFVLNNNLSNKYDEYKNHIIEQENKNRIIELQKKLNKNILQSKLKNIFKELYDNKEDIKKSREEKVTKLKNKMRLNIIKSKTIESMRVLIDDKNNIEKVLNKIKKNKNIKFENKKINDSAIKSNRSMMKFLSNLYEEKIINKTLTNKDFMVAVNEFHSDRNTTRMTFLCKIMYLLCNNDIIWNSNIIFKHIYSFQYIKEYQINNLIIGIETIIKSN